MSLITGKPSWKGGSLVPFWSCHNWYPLVNAKVICDTSDFPKSAAPNDTSGKILFGPENLTFHEYSRMNEKGFRSGRAILDFGKCGPVYEISASLQVKTE